MKTKKRGGTKKSSFFQRSNDNEDEIEKLELQIDTLKNMISDLYSKLDDPMSGYVLIGFRETNVSSYNYSGNGTPTFAHNSISMDQLVVQLTDQYSSHRLNQSLFLLDSLKYLKNIKVLNLNDDGLSYMHNNKIIHLGSTPPNWTKEDLSNVKTICHQYGVKVTHNGLPFDI
jgi:hypothetical protein